MVSAAVGAGDDDGLLVEGGEDLVDQAFGHARVRAVGDRGELAASGLAQPGRAAAARQQVQHGRVVDLRAEDPFQGGVDLGEQAADPVARAGGLAGEVVVEADQDVQLGEGLVAGVDPAQVWGIVRAASAMT